MKSTGERQRRSSLRAETMPRLARDLVASRPCRLPGAAGLRCLRPTCGG
jgi:hypothetical protein